MPTTFTSASRRRCPPGGCRVAGCQGRQHPRLRRLIVAAAGYVVPCRGSRLGGALAARPEWWVYLLSAGAWAGLGVTILDPGTSAGHGHHAHGVQGAASSVTLDSAFYLLMVAAMMLPLVAPAVRYVVRATLWRAGTGWRRTTLRDSVPRGGVRRQRRGRADRASHSRRPRGLDRRRCCARGALAGTESAAAGAETVWRPPRTRVERVARLVSSAPGGRPPRRALRRDVRPLDAPDVRHAQRAADGRGLRPAGVERRAGPNPFAEKRWQAPATAFATIAAVAAVNATLA